MKITDIAHTTAFLYSGALEGANKLENLSLKDRGIAIDLWGDWGGHAQFVHACAEFAEAIEGFLGAPERDSDDHPALLAYEVIEPLGAWLIAPESGHPDAGAVLQEFQRRYLSWIAEDSMESCVNPTSNESGVPGFMDPSRLQHCATTLANHVAGEIGYCEFHSALPNRTKLYALLPK